MTTELKHDLFELIISYLPIIDKLRYESVSKRFQRLVFNKQNVLVISWCDDSVDSLSEHHIRKNGEINVSKLEIVLKKFRFITAIEFDSYYFNRSEVLKTIIQNCDHLTSIDLPLHQINSETLQEFCKKFGQQLRHISFAQYHLTYSKVLVKYILKRSPNLKSIKHLNVEDLNEFVFKKMKKIKLELVWGSEKSPIPARNIKKLEYLCIRILPEVSNTILFNELKILKYLKVLKINCKRSRFQEEFWVQNIKTIATNCVGLESFKFELIPDEFPKDFNQMICFQSITYFRGLKTLRFITYCEQPITDLSALKNCKNLLILELNVGFIDHNIYDGIHLIVPQLKKLSIDAFRSFKMTDKGLKSIAKLKYLSHLWLKSCELDITAKGLKNLIDSCERLKFVDIYFSSITKTCFGSNIRKLRKIIGHHQKYRKRVETRDEVNTKPLKCFWILWNRMKRWIQKTDTKQRSHCIQFEFHKSLFN